LRSFRVVQPIASYIIRPPAIIASIAFMLVAAFIVRELGGGKFSQGMTAVAVLCAPHYLGSQGKLATDGVEPFFWALGSLVLVRMIRREDPRMWLWFGLFAGLGLQAKHSTAFFGAAMVTALMLTPERRLIRTCWSVLGGLVALAVFLPNLIWEYRHGWVTLELLRNVSDSGKNVVLGPGMYFVHQLGQMHPIGSLLWLAGLAWFLFGSARRRRRFGPRRGSAAALAVIRRQAHLPQQLLEAGVGANAVETGKDADVGHIRITGLETFFEPLDGFILLSGHSVTARNIKWQSECFGKAADQGLGPPFIAPTYPPCA